MSTRKQGSVVNDNGALDGHVDVVRADSALLHTLSATTASRQDRS
jgi:hypothetical protein